METRGRNRIGRRRRPCRRCRRRRRRGPGRAGPRRRRAGDVFDGLGWAESRPTVSLVLLTIRSTVSVTVGVAWPTSTVSPTERVASSVSGGRPALGTVPPVPLVGWPLPPPPSRRGPWRRCRCGGRGGLARGRTGVTPSPSARLSAPLPAAGLGGDGLLVAVQRAPAKRAGRGRAGTRSRACRRRRRRRRPRPQPPRRRACRSRPRADRTASAVARSSPGRRRCGCAEQREREQAGDLPGGAPGQRDVREDRLVEPGGERLPPAWPAMRDVPRQAALLARPEAAGGGRLDQALDAPAACAVDNSSYSSLRRRRARNSVPSTAGRLIPRRSPTAVTAPRATHDEDPSWVSDSPTKPRRADRRSPARRRPRASGLGSEPTSLPWSLASSPSSAWSETSWARRERRNWSMQAFLAIRRPTA